MSRIAALGLLLIICMGPGASARALQVLEAGDHAELVAEISDSDVNRIAVEGDRIARVIHSPRGFVVEHDPVGGDLYLHADPSVLRTADVLPTAGVQRMANPRTADARAPTSATLFLGTERGYTYRLSLSAVSRGSAQILIRNAAIAAGADDVSTITADGRRGELVSLILAVARREPLAGYVIVPAHETEESSGRGSLLEVWSGARFTARVLSLPAGRVGDAQRLATRAGPGVAAVWLSAPGWESDGTRTAVLVEDNAGAEAAR